MSLNSAEKSIVLIASVVSFLVAFLSSGASIALPSIAKTFGLSNVVQNWVATLFLLIIAIFSVPVGKLAGIYGLKKSLMVGTIIFLVGSIGSALAFSGNILLFFRAVQGLGATFLNIASMAMIVEAISPQNRGRALGYNVTGVYIGLSLAPVISGFLTYNFGWRSLFLVTIPFIFISIFLILFKIKDEWKQGESDLFDIKGSIIYSISILLFIYGFSILNTNLGLILTILGLLLLVLFVIFEKKQEFPVFDMHLFKNAKFTSSNIASLISYFATFVVVYILNYEFQYIRGLDSQTAGLILIITPVLMAICSPFSGRLSDKINPQKLSALGMFLVSIAIFILCFLSKGLPLYLIIFAMFLQGVGYGIFASPNNNSIMSSVPKKDIPTASASLSTMRVIGQTMSLGMLTLIFSIFMGNVPIVPSNYPLLILSLKYTAIICTVLCIIAVLASLVGIKSKDSYNF